MKDLPAGFVIEDIKRRFPYYTGEYPRGGR